MLMENENHFGFNRGARSVPGPTELDIRKWGRQDAGQRDWIIKERNRLWDGSGELDRPGFRI